MAGVQFPSHCLVRDKPRAMALCTAPERAAGSSGLLGALRPAARYSAQVGDSAQCHKCSAAIPGAWGTGCPRLCCSAQPGKGKEGFVFFSFMTLRSQPPPPPSRAPCHGSTGTRYCVPAPSSPGAVRHNLTQLLLLPKSEVQQDSTHSCFRRDKNRNKSKVCASFAHRLDTAVVTQSAFKLRGWCCMFGSSLSPAPAHHTPLGSHKAVPHPMGSQPALCSPLTAPFADPMELSHF